MLQESFHALCECVYGADDQQKIKAWRARGVRARVSVNFRKFSPIIARAARAREFDSLLSLSARFISY
jgi:hypothetical protein